MRRELLRWFHTQAPALAPAYEGALRMIEDAGFPGRVYFIAHAVRDIADRLVYALDHQLEGNRVQYENEMEVIASKWPSIDSTDAFDADLDAEDTVVIPVQLAKPIDGLVRAHRERRQRPSNYELLFRFLMRNEPSRPRVNERLVADFKKTRGWFMDRAHIRRKKPPQVDENELRSQFTKFEKMLHSFVGSFFTGTRQLDDILQAANGTTETSFTLPTEKQIEAAVPLLSSPQHERYFFMRLDNPLWIQPLWDRKFFGKPPSSEPVEGRGSRHPGWPASAYLARMASKAPEEVVEILEKIETDNWTVARDILNAAKAMPAAQGKRLAPMVAEFVRRGLLPHGRKEVAELCAKLAREGEPDSAMVLLRKALSVPADEEGQQRDEFWYIEGLKKDIIPAFVPVRAKDLLEYLCEQLERAIPSTKYERAPGDDGSCWWRPAIEDHEQNSDYQLAAKMVPCLRDVCEKGIRGNHTGLAEVLKVLSARKTAVFRRISLHVIRVFAEKAPELARQTVMDRDVFADSYLKHEYALLAGQCFPLLTDEERGRWLGWIDAGPEAIDPGWYDRQDDDEMRRVQKEWWQDYRLVWIRGHLTGERKKRVEDRFGAADIPGLAFFNVYTGGSNWVQRESPSSVEELCEMSFQAAVEHVCKWRQEASRFRGPSVGGLADTFGQYVASDAGALSAKAAALKNCPALYVRKFLTAMEAAVKEDKVIDLPAVLDLCKWVTDRPVDEDTSSADADDPMVEHDWQWCRDTVADLIEEICKKRPDLKHQTAIWEVIKPLLQSPCESYVVQREDEDPRLADYGNLFLTSPLGKVLQAVFEYARWIAKSQSVTKDGREVYHKGLGFMPEVKTALEAGLQEDSNFGVIGRAGYGWHMGLLYWLDKGWLKSRADGIFDLEKTENDATRVHGWAAWNCLLQYNRPHKEFYRILSKQFSYAVDQLATLDEDPKTSGEGPIERLGEHLMILYARGDLGDLSSGTDQQIMERLLTKAIRKVRTTAVRFVGATLRREEKDSEEELPKEVQNRFMDLWDWYWQRTGKDDAAANAQSGLFGWWFASGAFPVDWSITRLEAFVSVVPKPQPDSFIVERLAEVAGENPETSVRILACMVKGDDENWRVHGWRKEAEVVLKQAMAAGGKAKKEAELLIDHLGRRGFVEFGRLLGESDKAGIKGSGTPSS